MKYGEEYGSLEIKLIREVIFDDEEKLNAINSYCSADLNCEDFKIFSAYVPDKNTCGGFMFFKVQGQWVYFNEDEVESSYCA